MIKANDSERREYFRIDDDIYLEYESIDDNEFNDAPTTLANLHNSSFTLSAEFATLNNSIHPLLNNIKQIHPDIGEYLEFINHKIDSLNQLLLEKESSFDEDKVITANLSASGISFESSEPFQIATPLKLEIVLLPEKVGILIYGRVVAIKEIKGSDHKHISIHFDHIRPEDRELMIKHNLNKQMSDLRDKNENS